MPRKIAAGNWKMNGTRTSLSEIAAIASGLPGNAPLVVICPPALLLIPAAEVAGAVSLGAQDCHAERAGAFTGDISAPMIADTGAGYVIVGHSERRALHGETDTAVHAKAEAAHAAGLVAIICIGETLDEREAGRTLDIVGGQLDGSLPDGATAENTVVAYEPVWAIGTGKVASVAEIGEVHAFLRERLVARFGDEVGGAVSLLYGGSVKAGNAGEIFGVAHVDGALVGGASLNAGDFLPIVSALAEG